MKPTPDSIMPLNGGVASPDQKDPDAPQYNISPKASIWAPPPLMYQKGKSQVCRKLPDSDQVEIEVNLSRDDSSRDSSSQSDSSWIILLGVPSQLEILVQENKSYLRKFIWALALLLYIGYFIWAVILDHNRAFPLIVITSVVIVIALIGLFLRCFHDQLKKTSANFSDCVNNRWTILRWFVYPLIIIIVAAIITYKVWNRPSNLISLAGLTFFVLLLFLFSKDRSQVKWRPVFWGLGLQFCLAMFIQWQPGYEVFKFIGDEVQKFLSYTDEGSSFIFGAKFTEHPFAFKVLPVIIFFSCAISVLYHLGVMQRVVGAIAWVMRVTLGTTAAESLSAAGNIFVGQTEAPILIRPYLEIMTRSELHAIMTGGFATIAGGVLAAYILFGIPAEHLICASVMNAPCALAVSKLFYPETEKSQLATSKDLPKQEKSERNVLEAAAAGASSAIMLVANVAANLIAFLAMLAFVNATFSWFGNMVDYPDLSFQVICSYVFMPVAFLMGVDWKDAGVVGELIGIKMFLNEFVAYKDLSDFIDNRVNCVGPTISVRSEVIATYALCGFANLSSIGIQLGGIGPMAPSRKGDLASIAVRALAAGTITSLITSCVAGLLIVQDPGVLSCGFNTTDVYNGTDLILNATSVLNVTTLSL